MHDLGGSWVVPGLVDTHPHLLHFSVASAGLADLADATDHADVVAAIAAVAATRSPGQWVMATRDEALRMWTGGGAAVLGWPELGRLTPGAYADLVVLDRDPLTCALDELPTVGVLATITDGRVVTGDLA